MPLSLNEITDPKVRKAAARTLVTASKGTKTILPRWVYELAGAPVPDNATDELQRVPPEDSLF
ncbi:hypothetical protein [Corynebacterium variabile]|uniref:hypothetical protein n=1 Tax=Corynebacterium variabile TaxID=1727 RepID=UPI003A948C97